MALDFFRTVEICCKWSCLCVLRVIGVGRQRPIRLLYLLVIQIHPQIDCNHNAHMRHIHTCRSTLTAIITTQPRPLILKGHNLKSGAIVSHGVKQQLPMYSNRTPTKQCHLPVSSSRTFPTMISSPKPILNTPNNTRTYAHSHTTNTCCSGAT